MRQHDVNAPLRGPILALSGLALAGYMAVAALEPPRPIARDAPATAFSAGRAMRLVEELAQRPRPPGSAEHRRVREALLAELASLGLEPEVQREVTARARRRTVAAARVENILARLPGTTGAGAILLLAHYDSRSTTPGAGDDLAGVATVLETVRALRAGAQLRNDVIVLLSDAEEAGLLGARAFAEEHSWMADVSLVLNFEARGNRGMATMFETGDGALSLVRALRDVAPYPYASSLSGEVYRRMPNDTDFTVFRDAGVAGLNFSFFHGLAAYHTALDTPARLDPRSLQHLGSYALGLTRHFGDRDLAAAAAGDEAVYFNLFGWAMVIYPAALALPLALLVAAGLAGLTLVAVERGLLRVRGVTVALAAVAGVLLLVPSVAHAVWWLFTRLAVGRLQGPYGLPYRPGLIGLALAFVALALTLAIYRRAAGRTSSVELGVAALAFWTLALLAGSALVPGASYVLLWPVVGVGLALAVVVARRSHGGELVALLALGALPAVVLLVPLLDQLLAALTLSATAVVALIFAFFLVLLGPLLTSLAGGARWPPAAAGGIALLFLGVWLLRAGHDDDRPRIDSLLYAYDADDREARWLSFDHRSDDWTAGVLDGAERGPAPAFLPLGRDRSMLRREAPVAPLPYPRVEVVQDLRGDGGGRSLSLFVISPRRAPLLWLEARSEAAVESLWLDGEQYRFAAGDDAAPIRLRFFGLPAAGLALTLELAGDAPLELSVVDQSWGLPAVDGAPGPRPPGIIPNPSWLSDATLVHRSYSF